MQNRVQKVRTLACSTSMQTLFFSIFTVLVFLIGWLLQTYDQRVTDFKNGDPSYNWPPYSDLLIGGVTALCYLTLHVSMRRFLPKWCDSYIKPEFTGEEREERIERHIGFLFRSFHFIVATVFGYWAIKDSSFLPPTLGGSGDPYNSFDGYPYQDQSTFSYARMYIMLGLGYHASNFLDHFTQPMKKDFIEMALHHFITVFLISLAYFMNYIATSSLVLFRSDLSDIFISVSRASVDTRFTKLTNVSYVVLLISWVYLRLFVSPREILWRGIIANPLVLTLYGTYTMFSMLVTLLVLELYWTVLLINIGLKLLKKGEITDPNNAEVPGVKLSSKAD